MFGLSSEQWRDLVLSVNVHRKNRRLSPVEVAEHLRKALEQVDVDTLAESLGFADTTTMKKILRLNEMPDGIATVVTWGISGRGTLSMSTATELLRLSSHNLVAGAMKAAVEYGITREEARQIVQIRKRSGAPIAECVRQALRTRPRIERSELIMGTLLTDIARQHVARLGVDSITKQVRRMLARNYPDVMCQAVRISAERFSLLFSEENANAFRAAIGDDSVEVTITRLVDSIKVE